IGPKPCIPPKSWIPFISSVPFVLSRWRIHFGNSDHRVASDQRGKFILRQLFGARRSLGKHQVAQLSRRIPWAHFDFLIEFRAEFLQNTTRIAHRARAIWSRFVPNGRQTERRPRIAGAKRAYAKVVHLGCVFYDDHVISLQAGEAEFLDGGSRIFEKALLISWIDPSMRYHISASSRPNVIFICFGQSINCVLVDQSLLCEEAFKRTHTDCCIRFRSCDVIFGHSNSLAEGS